MNAPLASPINGHALPDAIDTRSPAEIFAGHCEARAMRVVEGILSIREASDELQAYAKLSGLIEMISQDKIQEIMSKAFAMAEAAPDELSEVYEREIMVRVADRVRQWELEDQRDAWRVTGEAPPPVNVRNSDISGKPAKAPQFRTPQSVIDAFFYVLKTKDAAGIAEWLAAHPQDERYLQKIWEQKCSTAAAR